jgi:hypothetical protein
MNINQYKMAQPIEDLKANFKKRESMVSDGGINNKNKFVLIRG